MRCSIWWISRARPCTRAVSCPCRSSAAAIACSTWARQPAQAASESCRFSILRMLALAVLKIFSEGRISMALWTRERASCSFGRELLRASAMACALRKQSWETRSERARPSSITRSARAQWCRLTQAAAMFRQSCTSSDFRMSRSALSVSSSPSHSRTLSSLQVMKNSLYFSRSSPNASAGSSFSSFSSGISILEPVSEISSMLCSEGMGSERRESVRGSAYSSQRKRERARSQQSRAWQYLALLQYLLPFSRSSSQAMKREQHSSPRTFLQSSPLQNSVCCRQIGYFSNTSRDTGGRPAFIEKSSLLADRQYLNFDTNGSSNPVSVRPSGGFFFLSEPPMKGQPPRGFSSSSESDSVDFLSLADADTGHLAELGDSSFLFFMKGHSLASASATLGCLKGISWLGNSGSCEPPHIFLILENMGREQGIIQIFLSIISIDVSPAFD